MDSATQNKGTRDVGETYSSLHWWGWAAVVLLICAVLMPQLMSWGMFLDGITYATVSRNLSIGLGIWWQPHYTSTLYPAFHEQLPLGFMLQSVFFMIAGDHYLVEKAYSFMIMLGTLLLLRHIWMCLATSMREANLRPYSWMPILLWITIPKWNWAYKSNILENTMGFFCLLSFCLMLRAILTQRSVRIALYSIAAAGALVAACLTKGPAGLFPLVAPVIMVFALKSPQVRRGLIVTLICSVTLVLCAACMAAYDPLRANLMLYCNQHLLPALFGQRHTGTERSDVFLSLSENLAPMIFVLLIYIAVARKRLESFAHTRHILLCGLGCLLVGLAGSIPLLVSHKFRSFYLVPSFPFFALGFGMLLTSLTMRASRTRMHRLEFLAASRYAKAIMILLLVCILAWSTSLVGTPRKDREIHGQLASLAQRIPPHTIFGGDQGLRTNWSYHALLHRYLLVSLDASRTSVSRDYFLNPLGQASPNGFVGTGLTFGNCLLLERIPVQDNSTQRNAEQRTERDRQ